MLGQQTLVRDETAILTTSFVYNQLIADAHFKCNSVSEHCVLISYNCLDTAATLFVDVQFSMDDMGVTSASSKWISVCQQAEATGAVTLTQETCQVNPAAVARTGRAWKISGFTGNKMQIGVKETGGTARGYCTVSINSWSQSGDQVQY